MRRRFIVPFFTLVGMFLAISLSHAETKTLTAEATYTMGDGEQPSFAEAQVLQRAKQSALEQAGTYVESYTKVHNYDLTTEEIQTLAGGVMEVEVLDKTRQLVGDGIRFSIKIKATVTTDKMEELAQRIKGKNVAEQYQKLQADYARLRRELELIKQLAAKTPVGPDREAALDQIREQEKAFTRVQQDEVALFQRLVSGPALVVEIDDKKARIDQLLARIVQEGHVIKIGKVEVFPLADKEVSPPADKIMLPSSGIHVVKPGETLFRIARRYGIEVDKLMILNKLSDDIIEVGQKLVLREGSGLEFGANTYGAEASSQWQPPTWPPTNKGALSTYGEHIEKAAAAIKARQDELKLAMADDAYQSKPSSEQTNVLIVVPVRIEPAGMLRELFQQFATANGGKHLFDGETTIKACERIGERMGSDNIQPTFSPPSRSNYREGCLRQFERTNRVYVTTISDQPAINRYFASQLKDLFLVVQLSFDDEAVFTCKVHPYFVSGILPVTDNFEYGSGDADKFVLPWGPVEFSIERAMTKDHLAKLKSIVAGYQKKSAIRDGFCKVKLKSGR